MVPISSDVRHTFLHLYICDNYIPNYILVAYIGDFYYNNVFFYALSLSPGHNFLIAGDELLGVFFF